MLAAVTGIRSVAAAHCPVAVPDARLIKKCTVGREAYGVSSKPDGSRVIHRLLHSICVQAQACELVGPSELKSLLIGDN